MPPTLGEFVREKRLDAGFPHIKGEFTDRVAKELARNPDTLRSELSKAENDTIDYPDAMLHAIAKVTGVPFLEFDRVKRNAPPTREELLDQSLRRAEAMAERQERILERLERQESSRKR